MKIKTFLVELTVFMALSNSAVLAASNISTDSSNAILKERIAHVTPEQKEARIEEMKARVKENKAMDKSQLSKEDRKALRQELRNLNKEAREMGYTYVIFHSEGLL